MNILLRPFALTWCNEVSTWNYNLVRIQVLITDTKNLHTIVINLHHLLITLALNNTGTIQRESFVIEKEYDLATMASSN
jgi:hypothetical protein